MKKICCILTLIVLLLNSSALLVISQAVDAIYEAVSTEDSNNKAVTDVNLEKYINFKEGENKGTLIELNLDAHIEQKEEKDCYVKNMAITLECPKINEKYPEEVKIISNENIKFEYNKDSGKLEIKQENKEPQKYEGNTKYNVALIYGEDVYIDSKDLRYIETKISVIYELEEKEDNTTKKEKLTAWHSRKVPVTENVGTVVSIDHETQTIYDGYINNNIKNNTTYETEYTEKSKVEVSYKELAKEIVLTETNTFMKDEEEIENQAALMYKTISFEKSNLENALEENGYIEVLDVNQNVIRTITKDTESENEKIIIEFEQPVKQIALKIYNAKEGVLEFESTKVINSNLKQNIDAVKTITTINEVKQEKITKIENATTQISLETNKVNLKNNVQNDVTFTAILKADTKDCKLFNSPVLEIELPEEVEKVLVWDTQVTFDKKISEEKTEVIPNNEGKKVIKVTLQGEQTEYVNELQKGINVIISTSIILKQNITTQTSEIKMKCTQNEENVETTIPVNLIANNINTDEEPKDDYENIQTIEGLKIETAVVLGDRNLLNGDTVYEKQILKYKVKVTNTTTSNVENLKIIGKIADGTTYVTLTQSTYLDSIYKYNPDASVTQKDINIGTIKPNESKEYFYEVQVNTLEESEKELKSIIDIYSAENKVYEYTLTNTIKKAEMQVELKSYIGRDEKNSWYYDLYVTNLTSRTLEDVVITIDIPKELTIKRTLLYENGGIDVGELNGNKLTIKLDSILAESRKNIKINTVASNVTENADCSYTLSMVATVQAKGTNTYKSNENRVSGHIEGVTIEQTSDKSGEKLRLDDEVTYTFKIKNIGYILPEFGNFTIIKVKDYLPEELYITDITYENYKIKYELGEETTLDGKTLQEIKSQELEKVTEKYTGKTDEMNLDLVLPLGETLTIKITGKAKTVYEDTTIENSAIVTGETITTKQSNIIKNTILKYDYQENEDKPIEPEEPGENVQPDPAKTYKISGLAWLDENENGKREDEEKLLPNIKVKLVQESDSKIIKETITSSNGAYEFNEVNGGKYIVVFEYDNTEYSITTYQKTGISTNRNSDAIAKEANISGEKKKVGVTDTIILNADKGNIDIGLIENKIFDMKIEKYISKITVQTDDKTKTYDYKDKTLAKIDIDAKKIENTTIAVEYKIIVTNVGEIPGTISEIVDEIPTKLDFHSELNTDWAKTASTSASNTSLMNQELAAGESKELTLILTKTLTESSIGKITNIAKIGISGNSKNISDNNTQNDSASAEILLSIRTGAVAYFGTVIAVLAIICLVIFIGLIVFKKGFRYRFFTLILIGGVAIGVLGQSKDVSIAASSLPEVVYIREAGSNHNGPYVDQDGNEYTCQDAGYNMCGKWHKYTLVSTEEVTSKHVTNSWYDETISLNKQGTNIEYVGEVNGKDIYGPFKVKCNLSGATYTVKVYNENGNEISYSIVNRDGTGTSVSSDSDFYIQVSKDVNALSQVKVKASKTTTKHSEWSREVRGTYACTELSPDDTWCTAGHGPNGATAVQGMKMNRSFEETGDDTETVTIEAEVVFKVDELPKTLFLEKINNEDSSIKFAGVQFVLKNNSKGYVKQDNIKHITYVQNESEATKFETDATGKLMVKGLNSGKHTIKEVYNPNYGYDTDGDYITWIVNGTTKTGQEVEFDIASNTAQLGITAKNEQKYVRISGIVWEDISNTKDGSTDNVYTQSSSEYTSNDKLVQGIKVTLHDTKNNKTYETYTNAEGAYMFGSRQDNGTYSEDNLLVRDLDKYYVEFEYNGVKYTSVVSKLDVENGSKSEEPNSSRKDVNERFEVISGKELKNEQNATTVGQAQNLDNTINYTGSFEDYSSSINYTEGNSGINDYYAVDKYHIQSNTSETGYNIKTSYVLNEPEIKNINLGIVQREQTDLSISEDIANVVVKVNGYTHTYEYGARGNEDSNFNVGVKFGDKYTNRYTRTIYPSDIEWKKEDMDNHTLEVYIKYKISIKNQSTTLVAKVNELVNYYDKQYTIVSVEGASNYTAERKENGQFIETRLSGIDNIEAQKAKDVYITFKLSDEAVLGLLNQSRTLDNMTEITSYSTFYGNLTGVGSENRETQKAYASIDLDSAPGNAKIELDSNNRLVKTTYEDDTDMAPSLLLSAEVKKAMSGTVFEDNAIEESLRQEERYGDGIYNSGENVVYNAKVELLDKDTKQIAYLYDKDSKKEAVTYTDKNGNYTLVGIVPDEYILRYTYGNISYILDPKITYTFNEDGSITYKTQNELGQEIDKKVEAVDVRDYKSTVITSKVIEQALQTDANGNVTGKGNLNWLVDSDNETKQTGNRYSDAVDDLNLRAKIDEQPVNYKSVTEYLNDINFNMEASTAEFNIGVEFTTIQDYTSNTNFAQEYQLDENGNIKYDENGNPMPKDEFITADENIDFGIAERARQDIIIDKQIANISIILANGQVLLSGDPRTEQMPYVKTGIDDLVPIEIDTELIQGATLKINYEITLSNNSEKDYVYTNKSGKNYYFFGRKDGAEELMTDIELVADYMNDKLAYTIDEKTNTDWQDTITAKQLLDAGQISEEVYNEIKSGYSIFTTTAFNEVKRKDSKTITLTASKLLSASEDMTYKNSVEILQLKSEVGRTIMNSIPGNFNPKGEPVEQDEDQVILVITPPTGIKDYAGYIIFTISMLVVLGVGVYMIKRKVIG